MASSPILIDEPNISRAWAKAFLATKAAPHHRLESLTLSFSGFEASAAFEERNVRSALETALLQAGMSRIQTVANTIFPDVLWRIARGNRKAFYGIYRENLPHYV